jgi:hypothetical protein
MKNLLYLTILITSISCFDGSQGNTENTLSESTVDSTSVSKPVAGLESATKDVASVNQHLDTLVLDKQSVIFFMLNQQEYDSLMSASGDDAIDTNEGFSDFEYYAQKVSKQMQEKGINSDVVAHEVFKIIKQDGVEYFNRKAVPDADMGIIIFDGKTKPTIETGVMSEIDFLTLIEEKIK